MGLFGNKNNDDKAAKKEIKRQKKIDMYKKMFLSSLEENEIVIEYLAGTESLSKALNTQFMLLTDKRLLFRDKLSVTSVDLNNITSVESKLFSIEVKGSNFDVKLDTVKDGSVVDMANSIDKLRNKTKESSTVILNNSAEKTPVEQLKEYKELLDMKIITQEEFDTKKKELLNL